jgi:hypothetical protein
MPKLPRSIGNLIGYAREVNQAIQQLRDRAWEVPASPSSRSSTVLKLTLKKGTASDKFQVIPGTVNSVMPTLSGTALDNATPPEITVSADTWVWLKCVGTFGSPDTYDLTVETSATYATPAGTDITTTGFVSFFYIGKVDYTAGSPAAYAITNDYTGGNLGIESFGNVNLWWKT